MSSKPAAPCPICGGPIRLQNLRGEFMPYRDEPAIQLMTDVLVPHCATCDEEWLDRDATDRISAALEASYRATRREQVSEMISGLTADAGLEQKDIEAVMGLSAGYISKAKRGEKDLTPTTYRLLVLLREDPLAVVTIIAGIDPRLVAIQERLEQHLHVTS